MIEKGKWYKGKKFNGLVYSTSGHNSDGSGVFSGFGLNSIGEWRVKTHSRWVLIEGEEAKPSVVKERIIQEVNKRYSVGDIVKCLWSDYDIGTLDLEFIDEETLVFFGEVWVSCVNGDVICVMKDGEWAEVLEKRGGKNEDYLNSKINELKSENNELKRLVEIREEKIKSLQELNNSLVEVLRKITESL